MLQSRIEHSDLRRFVDATERFAGGRGLVIEPLAGDVSTRCYYRISRGAERAIAAWYPPDLRDAARRFARSTTLLTGAGVRVPAIFDVDSAAGFMLLEDVGSETLFDWRERPWEEVRPYLEAAYDAAQRVSAIAPAELAGSDAAARRRLARARAGDDLGRVPSSPRPRRRRGCRPPTAICLRRALRRARGRRPGRPATATSWRATWCRSPRVRSPSSIIRTCGSAQPPTTRRPCSTTASIRRRDQIEPIAGKELLASAAYHRAVAQRALKIVGTFASFARRGQPRHLPLVPRSLRRALDHLAALPESAALAAELEQRWAPALC